MAALDAAGTNLQQLAISRQVLREYLAAVTRAGGQSEPLSMAEAFDVTRFSGSFVILEDGPEVGERLVALCRLAPLGGRQVHDANIVATMLAHGERRLLTMNGRDFRRFEPRVEIVQP